VRDGAVEVLAADDAGEPVVLRDEDPALATPRWEVRRRAAIAPRRAFL
jgi:hypothetical protein